MCGIAGVLEPGRDRGPDELAQRARAMATTMAHRGPDGGGTWVDASVGLALAFRRLAIVDLSPTGDQPMTSRDGRHVMVFNGELYGFRVLRAELEAAGHRFRGTSDTEVLLEAIAAWGFERALARADGMFALALWDRRERRLWLARDRVGEKPLYHGWFGGRLLFASELKALRAHPAFDAEIDRDALAAFLRHKYVPGPSSIYRGVHKLEPGCWLRIDLDDTARPPRIERYWTLGGPDGTGGSPDDLVDELDALVARSVATRRIADVPVGAFLSGGVDSSVVVAHLAARASVRTFTVGFPGTDLDEADHADAVARHLGTEHTRVDVSAEDARQVIPRLPAIYDEPFADSSQIPTALICEVARRQVTVALTGDGGDELFGGYHRHRWIPAVHRRTRAVPLPVRRAVARLLAAPSPSAWASAARFAPARLRPPQPANKAAKLARVLGSDGPGAMYDQLTSHWTDAEDVVIGASPRTTGAGEELRHAGGDLAAAIMALDTRTYLPDDILVKLDRASMAVSLEARVPLLDPAVVAFAHSLPSSVRMAGGRSKVLLRRVLARYVPPALTDRPKAGFGVPIGAWLRGPLRDWADELLAPDRLGEDGYLRPEPVAALWAEHRSGRADWEYHLWDVLSFQSWLAHQRSVATVGSA